MAMDGCERKVPLEWPLLRMFVDRGGRGWTASWRKGWDSNPRGACAPGGFQDRCLKPLGHPSSLATSTTDALALADKSRHCRRIAVATDGRFSARTYLKQTAGTTGRAAAIRSGAIERGGPGAPPFPAKIKARRARAHKKETPAGMRG